MLPISVPSPSPEITVKELGIKNWPVWTCFLLEGEVTVTLNGAEPVMFGVGDLVVFPAGMDCKWDVHQAVRKHY
tara:strand:+ start:1100 stop:1321 length:222 start_codon:yes stop_codon:yes gene_type:complete